MPDPETRSDGSGTDSHGCCAPSRSERSEGYAGRGPAISGGIRPPEPDTLVVVPGGRFAMGSEHAGADPADGEGPVHEVEVTSFRIDAVAVDNQRFATFVDATGHVTDAERYGWSFVFAGHLPDDFPDTAGVAAAPWWRQVLGADWRHPEGPGSTVDDRASHPVVHVSWTDAAAYCAWTATSGPRRSGRTHPTATASTT